MKKSMKKDLGLLLTRDFIRKSLYEGYGSYGEHGYGSGYMTAMDTITTTSVSRMHMEKTVIR
jgi:hypothetical protein